MKGAHNSDVILGFYNDKVKEIIEAGIIAEPFTYVPIKAGHMELVSGNALVFGDITEGYDVIDASIETELAYQGTTYYGGAIGEEHLSPRVNLPVSKVLFQFITIVNWPDEYSPILEYHKGDYVFIWDGGVRRVFLCLQTVTGVTPDPYSTLDDAYWNYNSYWSANGAFLTFRRVSGVIIVTLPPIVYVDSYYYITVQNDEEGIPSTTAFYRAAPGDEIADVKAGLQAALLAAGISAGDIETGSADNQIYLFKRVRYYKQTPVYEAGDVNTNYKDFIFSAYILTLGNTFKYPDLKCGATHGYGIVYKDRAGRTCSVIKTGSMDIYIPFYTEDPARFIDSITKLKFKIFNSPPEWAETYEIVYFGNMTMDFFLQLRADNISLIPLSNGNRFSLNIQDTLNWTRDKNNRWKVDDYSWLSGDRLRLMGTIDVSTGITTKYDDLYDYEIEAVGDQYEGEAVGGDWLIFQAKDRPVNFENEHNILVEIYRPKKGLALSVAYGTGMVFDIATNVYGKKYHKGDVDQVVDENGSCTIPAEVENTANDCWKYARLNYEHETGNINVFWAESMFPSDWWGGQDINKKLTSAGFPFLDDLSQRQVDLPERIRHGGYLITGTRTNNIAHFTFEDFRDLPEKYGAIIGLREIGFTLKVIQLHKETSIYINRIQTFNPDGTEQFTLTSTFLGTMRPMDEDYGCQHPDSIVVNGRYMYYWDNNEGVFIRSAANGQQVLDIKMKRWFKDIVKWIQQMGGADLLETRTGINNEHEEVWLTFRMGEEIRGVIFSEKNGRFTSRINQITESYIHLGNFFAHLYQQTLWIMNLNEGQAWLTWVGIPTYAEIEVVSNIEPGSNKVFNAVAQLADHLLTSEERTVVIPQEASVSEDLMETNIPVWENTEGVNFGEILKDLNTPGNFISDNDRKMNGRPMRGRYCFVRLRTEEHDEKVRIDSVVIYSTSSERNP